MTYDAKETSQRGGNPVELYIWSKGTKTWRQTSAAVSVNHDGYGYTAATITRSDINQGAELNKADLTVTVPRDHPVAALFISGPPGDVVSLTVLRLHLDDGEAKMIWSGRVLAVKWQGSQATMSHESISTSQKQQGLRRKYGKGCPHTLFDEDCRLQRSDYMVVGDVDAFSANQVTVSEAASKANGYFNGGYMAWVNLDGDEDSRTITTHVGSVLTLTFPIHGMAIGDQVILYPGCNGTLAECDTKFSNSDNHGGFPFVPDVNPFNGTTIF